MGACEKKSFWVFFFCSLCVCLGWRLLRCVSVSTFFPFFFFQRFPPHKRLLFMYCSWSVAATFDQFYVNSASMHCSRTHKFHFLSIFLLKMGPTVLLTHLKIILLQCFQFSVFSFSKISSIQTHPMMNKYYMGNLKDRLLLYKY